MATAPYTILHDSIRLKVISWTITTANPDGQPYIFAGRYPDRSVQAFGTWGTTPTLKFQGTNEVTSPTHFYNLDDPQGTEISMTADKLDQVLQNTYQVRPYLSAGTGVTLTVIMCIRG